MWKKKRHGYVPICGTETGIAVDISAYKVGTSEMTDYNRNPTSGFTGSRYGTIKGLDATTEGFTFKEGRSFTFAVDKLDMDETAQQLAAVFNRYAG